MKTLEECLEIYYSNKTFDPFNESILIQFIYYLMNKKKSLKIG